VTFPFSVSLVLYTWLGMCLGHLPLLVFISRVVFVQYDILPCVLKEVLNIWMPTFVIIGVTVSLIAIGRGSSPCEYFHFRLSLYRFLFLVYGSRFPLLP